MIKSKHRNITRTIRLRIALQKRRRKSKKQAHLRSLTIIALLAGGIPIIAQNNNIEEGLCSYYAEYFHGRQTANGERFNMNDLTAAHLSLPFNTKIRVTNLNNQKSVVLRVNDRGPYVKRRILDVSKGAAKLLGMVREGVVKVQIEILDIQPVLQQDSIIPDNTPIISEEYLSKEKKPLSFPEPTSKNRRKDRPAEMLAAIGSNKRSTVFI